MCIKYRCIRSDSKECANAIKQYNEKCVHMSWHTMEECKRAACWNMYNRSECMTRDESIIIAIESRSW